MEYTSSVFEATHTGPFADEMHGHLWNVRIYWPALPIQDARWMNVRLESVLNRWDHHVLDGLVEPTNYGIAKAISDEMPDVVRVDVWREGRVPCGAIYEKGSRLERASSNGSDQENDGGVR